MAWDPAQYLKFGDERGRPFHDLIARIPALEVRQAVDLGCGTGEWTRLLVERWPDARVLGIDSSPEMLARAAARAIPGRLTFTLADVSSWRPEAPLDLVLSNAALHWLPDHEALFRRLAAWVAPGGALAVQMPGNHLAPARRLIDAIALTPRWSDLLGDLARRVVPVLELAAYAEILLGAGFAVDAWETTYLHLLRGEDPVLDWIRGTALLPFLERLGSEDGERQFLAEAGYALREAYPRAPGTDVTPFPFRRLFIVAARRGSPPLAP